MCGIVAYIGEDAESTLFKMLKKLEYRGYDSAGIATICEGDFDVIKTEGKVENLKDKLTSNDSYIGIGHTRWATHGKPTEINAHPHLSPNTEWAIVHNGIIENFSELKTELLSEGYSFRSDTDTEVIAALFEKYSTLNLNLQIQQVVSMLLGSFSFAVVCKKFPNTLILVKKKSPLYVATNGEKVYAASDPIAFENVNEYYIFEENEYCVAKNGTLDFFTFRGERVQKKPVPYDCSQISQTNTYPHHMLEEIYASPCALKRLCDAYESKQYIKKIETIKKFDFNKIYIVGCGTAYHSGLVGAKYFQKELNIPASAHIASEFKYNPPIIDKNTLCIFVSQSGETADTIAGMLEAKKKRAKSIAIVNSAHSTISRMANITLPIQAGVEIAVASTKAYTNQCAAFYILANMLSEKGTQATKQIRKLSNQIKKILSSTYVSELQSLTNKIKSTKNVFFIGKNYDYITACEASLKLKEISYINCSALPAGELKHGTLALVEKGVQVIAISTEKRLASKVENATNETLSRGASALTITTLDKEFPHSQVISLPHIKTELAPMLSIVPLWLMSYFVSISKSINPDSPRNLAKSVTVE